MFSALRAVLAEQFGPVAPWLEPQRRQALEQAHVLILLTDGVGLPLLPGRLTLRLLPHVVPRVMNRKHIASENGWESQIKFGC